MSNPAVSRSLEERRMAAFQTIIIWMTRILGSLTITLLLINVFTNFPAPLIIVNISVLLFAASAAYAVVLLKSHKTLLSFLLIAIPLMAISVALAFFLPQGSYLIAASSIVIGIIGSLALGEHAIKWAGAIGLILFTPLVVGAALNPASRIFDLWGVSQTPWGAYIVPFLLINAIGLIGVLVLMLRNVLREASREADRRRLLAEQARSEQAVALAAIEEQSAAQARLLDLVRDLETPVIPLLEGVLVLPLVGHLDPQRLGNLARRLLERITAERAHTVVIDVTAVPIMDSTSAGHLLKLTKGVRLLGAECMITGIRAKVADSLAGLDVNWDMIKTAASLRDGLAGLLANQAIDEA